MRAVKGRPAKGSNTRNKSCYISYNMTQISHTICEENTAQCPRTNTVWLCQMIMCGQRFMGYGRRPLHQQTSIYYYYCYCHRVTLRARDQQTNWILFMEALCESTSIKEKVWEDLTNWFIRKWMQNFSVCIFGINGKKKTVGSKKMLMIVNKIESWFWFIWSTRLVIWLI